MPGSTDNLCDRAIRHQLAGRLDSAEQLYRAVLHTDFRHGVGNYGLGMLLVQLQRPSEALPHLLCAMEGSPATPDYWLGYLEALLAAGRIDDARTTLAVGREHGLGGNAVEEFSRRLDASRPTRFESETQPVEGAGHWEAALAAALRLGNMPEARALARTMTERCPDNGVGWKAHGAFLWAEGSENEALAALQTSLRLLPLDAEAHSNFGLVMAKLERFSAAETSLFTALQIDPDYATAHYRLCETYTLQGRFREATASLQRALSLEDGGRAVGSSSVNRSMSADRSKGLSHLLYLLSHDPAMSADALFDEHRRVGESLDAGLVSSWPRHANRRDPDRRLKVGWVSGDFRTHAVASFFEPVFERLRMHSGLELHAYYNHAAEDPITEHLRGHFNYWHPIHALSDIELAAKIINDEIDILVDISGHTAFNRLEAFARKPAPLQVSWLGYVGTTGMRAVDYYLTDRHFLPRHDFERQFTEKLVYLPAAAPFTPHATAPPVNELPALTNRALHFGSFNRVGKLNTATIELWSRLLRALPETIMHVGAILEDAQRRPLIERFAACGIAPARVVFHARCGMDDYLALHHAVDICLDTQPWAGGTTTNHALSMGVPTLTVTGTTPASRLSAALLGQVGLEAFVATSADDFVAKGVYWSTHLAELSAVRAGLRRRCEAAPSRNPGVIAAGMDRALRHMWRRWCAGLPAESFDASADAPPLASPSVEPALDVPVTAVSRDHPASGESTRAARRRQAHGARHEEKTLLGLIDQRRMVEALVSARTLTERFPEHGAGWKILGALLGAAGRGAEAIDAMQSSIDLLPLDTEAHCNLGIEFMKVERGSDAEGCFRQALAIDPECAAAHYRLGMLLGRLGRYAEADLNLQRLLALKGDSLTADDELVHSTLLFIRSHDPAMTADGLCAAHRRVGEYLEAALRGSWPTHTNSRDPDRRLRVGLVSGDFRDHAVANFLEPIVAEWRADFGIELHGYSNHALEDHVTRRLKGHMQHWHRIADLSDAVLAKQILDDGIDILIDLSGHTLLHRLRTFAHKPAPIQASWLGYPGTTGLGAVDYYLADPHLLPPGEFDRYFTEKLVYLPAQAAFRPHPSAPPVNALPALATGSLVFGSFNRLGKINAVTVSAWAQLLRALPQSTLLLGDMPSDAPPSSVLELFAAEGIVRERLMFHGRCTMDAYLALHGTVDLCLDTQPWTGGATTNHALWMGVPTLTVTGSTPASRLSASILGQVGLTRFVSATVAELVDKGLYWAEHLDELAAIRADLRRRCEESPNRQPRILAAALAGALRRMWRRWCAGLPPESFTFELDACAPANLSTTDTIL
jgi:predicted O-linked N-acetylglucosamine transferase (SPINDLY family)